MINYSTILFPLLAAIMIYSVSANFHQDVEITWGDGRGQITNNGDLLTLSLDKSSGSGFQSKNEYLFGKIDMQIKLVAGNSAGTVTAYYVSPFTLTYKCLFKKKKLEQNKLNGFFCFLYS